MAFSNAHYNTFEIKIKKNWVKLHINISCKNQVNICKTNLNKTANIHNLGAAYINALSPRVVYDFAGGSFRSRELFDLKTQ